MYVSYSFTQKGSANLPMMKLSQMSQLNQNIDQQTWTSPIGEQFAKFWNHEPESIRFWRLSSNALFTLEVEGNRSFLRFNLASERSLQEVEAEIRILLALDKNSIRAAQPILSLSGRWIETAEWNGEKYHIVLFEGIPGEHLDDEHLTAEQCLRWGQELGNLHTAFSKLSPATFAGRKDWHSDLAHMQRQLANEDAEIVAALEDAAIQMEQLCATMPITLIHFDFEMDNLIWNEDTFSVIDFDDCRMYPPGADIEYAIRSLRKSEDPQVNQLIQSFMDGYTATSVYPVLSQAELEFFQQWHRLYLLAGCNRDMDLPASEPREPWQSHLELRFAEVSHKLRVDVMRYAEK